MGFPDQQKSWPVPLMERWAIFVFSFGLLYVVKKYLCIPIYTVKSVLIGFKKGPLQKQMVYT